MPSRQGRADIEGCVGSIARRNRLQADQRTGKPLKLMFWLTSVNRDIETRGVSQVENIEGVLQGGTLGDLGHLHERDIRAPLPGLSKDIALAMVDKVRLIGVIGRNCAVQSAWTQQRECRNSWR